MALESDDDAARIVDGDLDAPLANPAGDTPAIEQPTGFQLPEGFEAELFDTSSGILLTDKVKERFDGYKKSEEAHKKQISDLRGVISKGVKMPATAEEYAKDFVVDERFAHAYSEESENKEFLEVNLKAFDEKSLSLGLSKEQNKELKNMFHELLTDAGVIETLLTEEQKAAQDIENKKWVDEQYASLGGVENVRKVIAHYQNFNVLNEAERESIMKHMDGDTVLISAMNKLRIYTHGEEAGSDIPVTPSVGGLADDKSLAYEYNDSKTTDARRMEILQQRISSGRTGKLPLVF